MRLVVDADEIVDLCNNFHLSYRSTEQETSLVPIAFQSAAAHICGEYGTQRQKTEHDVMLLRLNRQISKATGGQKLVLGPIPGGSRLRDFTDDELSAWKTMTKAQISEFKVKAQDDLDKIVRLQVQRNDFHAQYEKIEEVRPANDAFSMSRHIV